MKRALVPLFLFAASLALPACESTQAPATSADASKPAPPVDWEGLAKRLVTQNAGVRENDVVQVSGGVQDIELMEDIAIEVRKVGAFPLVRIESDRMTRRMLDLVPEKYNSQPSQLDLKLAGLVNVRIWIEPRLAEDLFAGADPGRRDARDKANAVADEAFFKHNVRYVELGNNFYPTSWRAKRFGLTDDEMKKMFWDGVNVDYSGLQATGEQVSKVLSAGNEIHITNPNGTDLKLRIQGRPVSVSDGIISAEDAKKGGPASQVWLPAGDVYLVPVANSAEGKAVHTSDHFEGMEIHDLTLTFAKGKVTSMTGTGPGFQELKARYDAGEAGKDVFAYVDLGINPNIKLSPASKEGTWVPAGEITVGIGNNIWAGGDNKSGFGYAVFLPGSTVTLDGKPIIEKGQLQIK